MEETECGLVGIYWHFEATFCLYYQNGLSYGGRNFLRRIKPHIIYSTDIF